MTSSQFRPFREDVILLSIYDLLSIIVHLAEWEPYCLHALAQLSWAGHVLYRSCTTTHILQIGFRWFRWFRSWSVWCVIVFFFCFSRWYCLSDSTPDGGALCYVLRTGAYSFQGDLRRMIDFGSHGIREESKDAGVCDAAVPFMLLIRLFITFYCPAL